MRNTLLIVRLLHFDEKIHDIKLNIKGREKQLFKPVLRVFQNTEVLNDLLPVASRYVAQKREANYGTLYAFLYRAIRDLISDRKTSQLNPVSYGSISSLTYRVRKSLVKHYRMIPQSLGFYRRKQSHKHLSIFLEPKSKRPMGLRRYCLIYPN